MKKISAKVLSFILTAALILSFAPSVMVSAATTLPTGNSAGRLTDGLTVSYGDGTDMAPTELLTDGFYYSTAERVSLGIRPDADNGQRMITLDDTNRIIEFNWESEQSVKRLEMWIWRVGAVKDYEIQVFDGSEWVKHADGSFDQSQLLPLDSETKGGAAIFYLAQFKPVTTAKLRFVVKEFGNGQTSACVAEVLPRSTDMVNLLADNSLLEANLTTAYKHNASANPFRRVFSSPYAFGYTSSAQFSQWGTYGQTPSPNYASADEVNVWPFFSNGYPQKCITNPTGSDVAFYATSFLNSPQKINLIKVPSNNPGTYKYAKVYYSNASTKPGATSSEWILSTEIKGDFSTTNPAVISIPNAPKAMHWKVEIGNIQGDVRMMPVEMYSLNESAAAFGDGVTGNTDVLSDDFYYSSYDLKNSLSGAWLAESNLDKVMKFTQTGSGLEYSWDFAMDIKRVDLWILSVGGIEDYTLSYYNNGEWKTAKDSSFIKYDKEIVEPSAASNMNGATRASYYPIVLEETIKAEKLRFTIDSFYENNQTNVNKVPVAYVSEVKVRSHNNVNLGDLTCYGTTSGGRWSPYLHGFQVGAVTNSGSTSSTDGYSMPQWNGYMWPGYSDGNLAYLSQDFNCSTADAGIWYLSRFWRSKVKINRVGIELLSGSITEFEVWANRKDVTEPWDWKMEIPINSADWEKVATFRCNLTPSTDDVLFDIPNAFEASQYMIRATKYDKTASYTTKIEGFKLYALADSELTPFIETPTLTGTVAKGEEVSFNIFSCNNTDADSAVFFALYENEVLNSVNKISMPLAGIKEHSAKYTIPETAEGALSVKAFFWNGKTLNPILNSAPLTLQAAE